MTNITGIKLVHRELDSQKIRGFTSEHDAQHTNGQLLDAALAHLNAGDGDPTASRDWPWSPETFHVNTEISSLAKASALIIAEIDRRIASGEAEGEFFDVISHANPEEKIL